MNPSYACAHWSSHRQTNRCANSIFCRIRRRQWCERRDRRHNQSMADNQRRGQKPYDDTRNSMGSLHTRSDSIRNSPISPSNLCLLFQIALADSKKKAKVFLFFCATMIWSTARPTFALSHGMHVNPPKIVSFADMTTRVFFLWSHRRWNADAAKPCLLARYKSLKQSRGYFSFLFWRNNSIDIQLSNTDKLKSDRMSESIFGFNMLTSDESE